MSSHLLSNIGVAATAVVASAGAGAGRALVASSVRRTIQLNRINTNITTMTTSTVKEKNRIKPSFGLIPRLFSSSSAAAKMNLASVSEPSSSSASSDSPITVERRDDGISIIRFNRPSALNAMTVAMGEHFVSTIRQLSKDESLRCVILTGEGKAFSAGGDLEFLLARCDDTPAKNSPMMREFYSRFLSLLQLPVPIIAAINGPAIGAGMCVAAACDYRITARNVDLGFTFARLGLHPGQIQQVARE